MTSARGSTRDRVVSFRHPHPVKDTETGTIALDHEIVEVLVTDGEEIVAEARVRRADTGIPSLSGTVPVDVVTFARRGDPLSARTSCPSRFPPSQACRIGEPTSKETSHSCP